ncbi:hypothetical protein JKF63_04964 [Porcisia hertigi]|uniref:Uncharacterized protein n=1 Tax=Porcisia hertigi TaxID=2761500 RepID=A0A836IFR8_9TRYP|nr:hypothetical protein JKF63_04964 [Porcisia hertigi]
MKALPHVLADRQHRLQVHENTVVQDAAQRMGVAVQKLNACSASIHQCSNVIEGSVLLLGVRTVHTLLTELNHSLESIEAVASAWRTTAAVYQEHCAQYRELIVSIDQTQATMKERVKFLERELRALRSERDRKEQAYDTAILYVQRVLAEHTHWQETHGYNRQHWPMTDTCEEALAVLHAVRAEAHAPQSDGHSLRDSGMGRKMLSSSLKEDISGGVSELVCSRKSSVMMPTPRQRDVAHLPVFPAAVPSEASQDVVRRWCSTIAGRLGATQPSLHFAYVPPAAEVRVLREVLDMGTGSSSLIKDIHSAQARLTENSARVRRECLSSLHSLDAVRQELRELKAFLQHLLASHSPFQCMAGELLTRVRVHIEQVAARQAATATATATVLSRARESRLDGS